MIRLKETNLEKAKEILNFAEKENAFVNSVGEGDLTIYEVLENFGNSKNFKLYEIIFKDKTIGLISSFPNPKRFGDEVISIGAMYILPGQKGQGYGKAALQLFLEKVKKQGFKKAFTKTWSSNKASNKILKELGFKEEGRKAKDRVNGDDTIKYILEF
jgi:RimJ/RimL family protein N-acetyltransferase